MSSTALELSGGEGTGFLSRLNPVSKLLAITPAMGLLMLVTDPYTPLAFVGLSVVVTVVLSGHSPVHYLTLTMPLVGLAASFVLVYPFVVGGPEVASSPVVAVVGPVSVRQAGLRIGAATGLRILALATLSMLFVLTTDTESFLRALVQNLGLPYRIGYSAMAAFRFAPMIRADLRTVRGAHRIRGVPEGNGIRGRLRRVSRYAIPLFVNAIRRAERTALAMDARAFGAFDSRTHYRKESICPADIGFVAAFWALSGAIVWLIWEMDLLGALSLLR
ncbi:energy-coupling factor transporter transmembrane component T family protein (plasmid) [Haloarcula salina]|uniref:energy-coupling factor transporter transmembrane component T family protein n=1 Tax=Haloarcula salina TaxID=1429914 RepID=UPI003C704BB3